MPLLTRGRLRIPGRRFLAAGGYAAATAAKGAYMAGKGGKRILSHVPRGRRFFVQPAVSGTAGTGAGNPRFFPRVPYGRRFFTGFRGRQQQQQRDATKSSSSARKAFYIRWTTFLPAFAAFAFIANYLRRNAYEKEEQDRIIIDPDGDFEPVRVKGGWSVHVMHNLPLRGLSRLWGAFNAIPIPYPLREPSLRLYAALFGCDLTEIDPPNLVEYPSLGSFFARKLKPGARPIDLTVDVVSPADGTLLNFGVIESGNRVEQVKGLSYSLDHLLGIERDDKNNSTHVVRHAKLGDKVGQVIDEREFARINGIDYTLEELMGGDNEARKGHKVGDQGDMSVGRDDGIKQLQHDLNVASEMGVGAVVSPPSIPSSPSDKSSNNNNPVTSDSASDRSRKSRRSTISDEHVRDGNKLHFAVIYLAPGDYHRFHSPVAWVVERRRHFVGELFSVSPYMAKRLENLFVLNERVSLLGRWRHGFFSMVPVGATNVGSIKISFDQDLRTNAFVRRRDKPPSHPGTYVEATYAGASRILGGQPLTRGEEMGGFLLGSTIVLVFEAPQEFTWKVEKGQKVRVGMGLGKVA